MRWRRVWRTRKVECLRLEQQAVLNGIYDHKGDFDGGSGKRASEAN